MDISKYLDFFHDGSIIAVKHVKNKIEFSMSSAEVDREDMAEDILLSKDNRIQGKLHVEGIKILKIGDKFLRKNLKKSYDNGRIFDFKITNHYVEISVDWVNYPPNSRINEFDIIKIEAEKIWWENIPNLA